MTTQPSNPGGSSPSGPAMGSSFGPMAGFSNITRRDLFAAALLAGYTASEGCTFKDCWLQADAMLAADPANGQQMASKCTPATATECDNLGFRARSTTPPADLPTPEQVAREYCGDDSPPYGLARIADMIRRDRARRVVVQGIDPERLREVLKVEADGGDPKAWCDLLATACELPRPLSQEHEPRLVAALLRGMWRVYNLLAEHDAKGGA